MILDLDSQMDWGDTTGLVAFWGDHAVEHATIARGIAAQFDSGSQLFDLSDQGALQAWVTAVEATKRQQDAEAMPAPVRDWLDQHQALHVAELQAMGASASFDLSVLDLRDRDQFSDWLDTHQRLHALERQTLGI